MTGTIMKHYQQTGTETSGEGVPSFVMTVRFTKTFNVLPMGTYTCASPDVHHGSVLNGSGFTTLFIGMSEEGVLFPDPSITFATALTPVAYCDVVGVGGASGIEILTLNWTMHPEGCIGGGGEGHETLS